MLSKSFVVTFASLSLSLFAASAVHAAPTQWSVNDHWYEAIAGTTSWDAANAAAMSATFLGMPGHLATITSADENAFISALAPTPFLFMLGGLQDAAAATPGEGWSWVTGEPFVFTNWNAGEPNDSTGGENDGGIDEDRLGFWVTSNANGLTWNDITGAAEPGYVVEYEGAAAIPEPEIYAMMAAGLGLMGWMGRRKKLKEGAIA